MRRDVPLGRRNLLADPRRAAVSVLGVGLAVALMLLIQGLWSGTLSRITAYEDHVGVQLFVAEGGTRSFLSDVSTVAPSAVDLVREIPGAERADPVTARGLILDLHGTKVPVTLVGSLPRGLGGPWAIDVGHRVSADDEVVIDGGLAANQGYGVGDSLEILGSELRIVGLTPDTRALGNGGYVFVSRTASAGLLGGADPVSFVLVRTGDPVGVAARIRSRTGLAVLATSDVARGDRALYDDTMGSVVRAMLAIAVAAGTLIVALSVYSSVVERIREFGIVKALGASGGRLLAIVLGQTITLAFAGGVAGALLFMVGEVAVAAWLPQYHLELPGTVLVWASVVVAVMALVAAILPARRLGRLDPASVYRM